MRKALLFAILVLGLLTPHTALAVPTAISAAELVRELSGIWLRISMPLTEAGQGMDPNGVPRTENESDDGATEAGQGMDPNG